MKPIIGIVTRPVYSEENYNMYGVYEDITTAVKGAGGIPVGIVLNTDNEILNKIDGLIFQGGDDFTAYEKELIKTAYEKNIKTLGICLGMQLMGITFNGYLKDIANHKYKDRNYVHKIQIKKDSLLYDIFKKEKIMVNSRHKSALVDTSLNVTAISEDNVIEAIESKDKDFFLGVQWHPESMIKYDANSIELFKYFVDRCRE